MLEAVCPNGHRLQVPVEHAGLKLRCPACNAVFQLIGPRVESVTPAGAGAPQIATSAANAPASEPAPAINMGANPTPSATPAAPAAVNPAPTAPAAPTPISPAADSAGARWSEPLPSSSPPPSMSGSSSRVIPPGGLPLPRRDWQTQIHLWIKPVLVLGLVMVLTARGCDSLAVKNVERLQGAVALAEREFQLETTEAVAVLETQLGQANVTPTRKTELQKQLDDLKATHARRRTELEKGEWRQLSLAFEQSQIDARAGGYGRELLFLGGTILFALGLLTTALLGDGAERLLCSVLLAIIVFSVYIGGIAWTASILSQVGR